MLAAGTPSCDKNEAGSGSGTMPHEDVEVRFDSHLVEIADTRAHDDQWTPGDAVGIFMIGSGETLSSASISRGADNIRYVVTGSSGMMLPGAQPIYFPAAGNPVDFIAYYPYTSPLTGYIYPVDVSDQTDPEAIDLLYSSNVKNASASTPAVTLNFSHRLCRVVMNITAGAGVIFSDLAGITATFTGVNTTADFDLSNANLTYTGSVDNIVTTAGSGYTASAIILPTLAVTSTGRSVVFSSPKVSPRTWTIPDQMQFQAGNSYVYTVTITATGVTMVLTGVDSWTVDTPGSGTAVPN